MALILYPQNFSDKTAIMLELTTSRYQPPYNSQALLPAQPFTDTNTNTSHRPTPPVLSLPLELLHQIAAHYYTALPPLTITASTVHLPQHALTPLSLSSPLLSILPPSLYYAHATFSFPSPSLMRPFARSYKREETVRRVRLWYGVVGPLGVKMAGRREGGGKDDGENGKENDSQDWVFSLLEAFRALEEVVFVLVTDIGEGCERSEYGEAVEAWWGSVRDAMREGVAAKAKGGKRRGKGLMLRVKCEGLEGCWSERICGV